MSTATTIPAMSGASTDVISRYSGEKRSRIRCFWIMGRVNNPMRLIIAMVSCVWMKKSEDSFCLAWDMSSEILGRYGSSSEFNIREAN